MDENSQLGGIVKGALGAVGLGAVGSAIFLPAPYGIFVAVVVVLLAVALFGGYFLWRRMRARREREQFTSAIEAQTAAMPKAISDPAKRADLDRVRQKFQTGLQEFKSRGKDIYKLPWYVIIGESGSGKTEAIRHSGIDFPPGLQDELQGSGGTVNMDWWFTNRGIILDTAGSMLFNEARAGEAPEWREFLRLLKRARPHCPVNGLFLVLSVESLIRDSADTIAQKASRLAQQLDLIQRVLDVRFPVYLVVTKCDLLIGFREFFDNIDDPLLQHQMFGWSNPDPLDAAFRPDLVDEYLRSVAARLRRRRLALIRGGSGTGRLGETEQFFKSAYQLGVGPTGVSRRLDEVDSLFALPESVMRLAPRLRRYLETVFVAGEWSAKPVFLRGIYFTSSMREGKALDEAIALATGLPLDQLPEDKSWEKNRAFFLRDLFHDKVFRESGLVTRATNTLKLLRTRQMAIFGSAGAALLLLLVVAGIGYHKLHNSVSREAAMWQAATNWPQGEWSAPLVRAGATANAPFVYAGAEPVPGLGKMTAVQYQKELRNLVEKPLPVPFIFKPVSWLRRLRSGSDEGRPEAQRFVFEGGVLQPLLARTREKIQRQEPPPGDGPALERHRDALRALIQFEADAVKSKEPLGWGPAKMYLHDWVSYLTETDWKPDTNLIGVFTWTYDTQRGSKAGQWPPRALLEGDSLAKNAPIRVGLDHFQKASTFARTNIETQLTLLNSLADMLARYQLLEVAWLTNADASCGTLADAQATVQTAWTNLQATSPGSVQSLTNLSAAYLGLWTASSNASASSISYSIALIREKLPEGRKSTGLVPEVLTKLAEFGSQAAGPVRLSYETRQASLSRLDTDYISRATNSTLPSFQVRWSLFSDACALASTNVAPEERDLGTAWQRFTNLNLMAESYQKRVQGYGGPLARETRDKCGLIASNAIQRLKTGYVLSYAGLVSNQVARMLPSLGSADAVAGSTRWLGRVKTDLEAGPGVGIPDASLATVRTSLEYARNSLLEGMRSYLGRSSGFPVLLSGSQTRSVGELAGLRKVVEEMTKETQNSVWVCDNPSLRSLGADCGRYGAVLSGLINSEGSAAEWEIYFVPSERAEDKDLIYSYKYARVTLGRQESPWQDLTKATAGAPLAFGKGPVDAGLKIQWSKSWEDSTSAPVVEHTSWGLVGLLKAAEKPERLDEGRTWRFRLKPGTSADLKGAAVFEARLRSSLPKTEDWPK